MYTCHNILLKSNQEQKQKNKHNTTRPKTSAPKVGIIYVLYFKMVVLLWAIKAGYAVDVKRVEDSGGGDIYSN